VAKRRLTVKEICLTAAFTAITAAMSQVAVPLPFTPVPVTLSTLAVFMTGLTLKPRPAFLSQTVYLIIGAAGLPVFARFRGGADVLFGPTGGYLWAYPAMALFISASDRLFKNAKIKNGTFYPAFIAVILIISMFICYLFGTAWLARVMKINFTAALPLGVYPYIAADAAKIIVCVICAPPVKKRLSAYLF